MCESQLEPSERAAAPHANAAAWTCSDCGVSRTFRMHQKDFVQSRILVRLLHEFQRSRSDAGDAAALSTVLSLCRQFINAMQHTRMNSSNCCRVELGSSGAWIINVVRRSCSFPLCVFAVMAAGTQQPL